MNERGRGPKGYFHRMNLSVNEYEVAHNRKAPTQLGVHDEVTKARGEHSDDRDACAIN